MPTEFEYKFVLSMDFSECENNLREHAREIRRIRQGYLATSEGTTRVRSVYKGCEKPKWYFTFKQKVSNRVVEIEKEINDRDGNDLWKICIGKLKKTRYLLDHKDVTWEIDFFYKSDLLYFILAEVELDEGLPRPEIPPLLRDYVIYKVPLDTDEFSNKRLGDINYVQKIYSSLMSRRENTNGPNKEKKRKNL